MPKKNGCRAPARRSQLHRKNVPDLVQPPMSCLVDVGKDHLIAINDRSTITKIQLGVGQATDEA